MSDLDKESREGGKPGSPARFALGMAGVLAQSETVSRAFGPRLGFVLMVLAILAGSGVVATTIIVLVNRFH